MKSYKQKLEQLDCMLGQRNYDEETAHQEIHQGINNYVAGMIMESRLKHAKSLLETGFEIYTENDVWAPSRLKAPN